MLAAQAHRGKGIMEKIRIGVSTCLMGDPVRYDGGHAHDRYVTDTLGQYVEFVPVCPETEAGLGIPREPMRLVGDPESPRLLTIKTKRDMTDILVTWARKRVRELEKEDFCGFIFKSKSPSSGMERVKVYTESGMPVKKGVGLFARALVLPTRGLGLSSEPTAPKWEMEAGALRSWWCSPASRLQLNRG